MIRQMFKMIWRRKKRNLLLISEIFFSFLVLFAVAATAISSAVKYFTPLGFSYDNVWLLHTSWGSFESDYSKAEIDEAIHNIQREMESCNEIESVSWTAVNYPYSSSMMRTTFDWQGQEFTALYTQADDNLAEVLDIPVVEGRWFNSEDDASTMIPAVINGQMKERMFGDESAIGKTIKSEKKEYIVVGVVNRFRYRGEFNDHSEGIFARRAPGDTTSFPPDVAVFKVRPGTDMGFEKRLTDRLGSVATGWTFRIETLQDKRTSYLKEYVMGLGLTAIVAGFLVFNVALGLFGVLWYSIARRRREIGLRRAVGAHPGNITWQILGEALVLATIAIIAGIFIAAQVPLLGLDKSIGGFIYLLGMIGSTLMIYVLVSICALYPSRLAAMINPARALHDE